MLIIITIFLTGLAVGSFLNSVIYRLKTGEGFFFPPKSPQKFLRNLGELTGLERSYCPHCKHALTWQDLIPLLSFLTLKGKCRYCQGKISWQYPLIEISTALIFLLIFNSQFQISDQFSIFNFLILIYYWIIASFLIIIFVYDLKHFIIPDKIIYPAILVSGIWYLVSGIFFNLYTKYEILNVIFSALGAAAFFLAIVLISRGRWMGLGDPKLAFFMGLFLGFPNILVALFFSFLIGAIIGIGLIVFRKKALKSEVPFGPFLVTGTLIAFFWGETIISWYLNLFW